MSWFKKSPEELVGLAYQKNNIQPRPGEHWVLDQKDNRVIGPFPDWYTAHTRMSGLNLFEGEQTGERSTNYVLLDHNGTEVVIGACPKCGQTNCRAPLPNWTAIPDPEHDRLVNSWHKAHRN